LRFFDTNTAVVCEYRLSSFCVTKCLAKGLLLLALISRGGTLCAGQAAADSTNTAAEAANPGAKPDQKTIDDAVAAKAEVVEPFNPETIAAPLRAIVTIISTPERVQRRGGGLRVDIRAGAAPAVVQNEAMVQQCMQQLRPVMIGELEFVRLFCSNLTKEQRTQIKSKALAGLKEAAIVQASLQNGQTLQVAAGARTKGSNEPRAKIRDAIAASLKDTVSEEQWTAYTAAANKRMEKRKHTAIVAFVSRLDHQLYLSAEQRDKIVESISAKWQPQWEKWTQVFSMMQGNYLPMIPDQLVVPHLNDDQKKIWRTIPKNDHNVFWHNQQVQDPEIEAWWGPDVESDAPGQPAAQAVPFFGNGNLEISQ
jgi:hypothetical protein